MFDTEIGAYLLDPARRGYPLHELAEERGLAVTPTTRTPPARCSCTTSPPSSATQLDERGLTDLLTDIELPLVHVLRETEKVGIKLDTRRLEEVASRIRTDAASSSARSGSWRARSS